MNAQLEALTKLKDGWDGYDGVPPTKAAIDTCRLLHFTPMSGGAILIELHGRGRSGEAISVDIEIDDAGRIAQVTTDLQP